MSPTPPISWRTLPAPRLLYAATLLLPLAALAFLWRPAGAAWAVALALLVLVSLLDFFAAPAAQVSVIRELPERLFLGREQRLHIDFSVLAGSSTSLVKVRAIEDIPLDWEADPVIPTFTLRAGQTNRYSIVVRPLKRGRYSLGALHVVQETGLGLWRRVGKVEANTEARVYPDYQPGASTLAHKKDFGDLGQMRTRQRGEGTDFDSLREYRDGDELSHIDWKATSRLGKVISRQFTVEKDHDVMIALDCGRLMGSSYQGVTKFDFALRAALALAEASLRAGDRVGVLVFDDKVKCFVPPGKGGGQLGHILESLHAIQSSFKETDFQRALTYLGVHHRKRSLVVLLTDFIDRYTAGPMLMGMTTIARRHACLFVAVEDPTVEERLLEAPKDSAGLAGQAVAYGMRKSRGEVLEVLRRAGATVLNLQPDALTAPVINAYLRLQSSGAL